MQGLANLDPDVDAIYRLTQPLDVHFKSDIPAVALPRDVVCPWNSQNTLFAQDAFWGLLIPVTTTFRVCDIWRRYSESLALIAGQSQMSCLVTMLLTDPPDKLWNACLMIASASCDGASPGRKLLTDIPMELHPWTEGQHFLNS